MDDVDKKWHLAGSEEELKLTEFELQLWRIYYGFIRWQEECQKVSGNPELSADELAVLHIVRMKERPKTIADIGRILNRDNHFNINYNINKLLKTGLIEKVKTASKKQYQYKVSEKGKKNTEVYANARNNLIIKKFSTDLKSINLEEISDGLMRLKNIYEEAVLVASSHKVS